MHAQSDQLVKKKICPSVSISISISPPALHYHPKHVIPRREKKEKRTPSSHTAPTLPQSSPDQDHHLSHGPPRPPPQRRSPAARILLRIALLRAARELARVGGVGARVLLHRARALERGAGVEERRAVDLERAGRAGGALDGRGRGAEGAGEGLDVDGARGGGGGAGVARGGTGGGAGSGSTGSGTLGGAGGGVSGTGGGTSTSGSAAGDGDVSDGGLDLGLRDDGGEEVLGDDAADGVGLVVAGVAGGGGVADL